MADWDDVRRIALSLPEATEQPMHGLPSWRVRKKLFVWERPLRASELETLGDSAPSGAILGARVEHLVAKEALLADDPEVYFTTPHFDGYPSVLVRLERIAVGELEELVIEAGLRARLSGWPSSTSTPTRSWARPSRPARSRPRAGHRSAAR
jgi:hypothetical protein